MCGIAGGYFKSETDDLIVRQMLDALSHRGPDAQGVFNNGQVVIGHKRLSIIDLDARSNQPMTYENLIIVFNGEIYNYKSIREELKTEGYTFNSNSDTEVLLKSYFHWGKQCLHKLVGMFSFAIYNKEKHELVLCRDRLGVKPLYYFCYNQELIFASQVSALRKPLGDTPKIDKAGLLNYLRFGYFPGKRTIFEQINKVLPGQLVTFGKGHLVKEFYWQAESFIHSKNSFRDLDEAADELEEILIKSFKHRMVADVPVGIFFSGGIDSTLLAAILKKHYGDINTFTIGFDYGPNNEANFAKQIAAHLQVNHTQEILQTEDAQKLFSQFYDIFDEPFHDTSGIPTAMVTLLAKKHGMKVVLSADGGDELFGGYPIYYRAGHIHKKISSQNPRIKSPLINGLSFVEKLFGSNVHWKNLSHRLDKLKELLSAHDFQEVYESLITTVSLKKSYAFLDDETFNERERSRLDKNLNVYEQAMLWDLKYFLPDDLLLKVDRSTMYHSVEGREPFLDHNLVEFALKLPLEYKMKNGEHKIILKHLLSRYLPKSLYERPKQGFSIPLRSWFNQYLDGGFGDKFSGQQFHKMGIPINTKVIQQEIDKYYKLNKQSKDYNTLHAFKLASLLMWAQKHTMK